MGFLGRFRRNKNNRTPTDEEKSANLNAEGDIQAKLPPTTTAASNPPQWSNLHKKDTEQGPATDYDRFDDEVMDDTPVYVVKQRRGYFSILFSLAQTAILIAMMVECSVAPISVNRKFDRLTFIFDHDESIVHIMYCVC